MSTECAIDRCHEPATETTKLLGILRHVCRHHVEGEASATDGDVSVCVPAQPIFDSALYPLQLLAECTGISEEQLRHAEDDGLRVRRFEGAEWTHGSDFIWYVSNAADRSAPPASIPF